MSEIKDKVRATHTRYPVTDKGSIPCGKINILTTNSNLGTLKIIKDNVAIYTLADMCDITPYIDNPVSHIYEETEKISNLLLPGLNGDLRRLRIKNCLKNNKFFSNLI